MTDIVYHGTRESFDLKDIYFPAYFTSSPELAERFAGNKEDQSKVLAIRLEPSSPQKVYEINWGTQSWSGMFPENEELFQEFLNYTGEYEPEEREYWEENGMTVDYLSSLMMSKGYDLVICRNVLEEYDIISDIYVAGNNCKIIA